MSVDQLASLAGEHPVPPEVFAKHRDLIKSNPPLTHLSVVNFQAFRGWVVRHNEADASEIANEWINRGPMFTYWYAQVILPLFTIV
jgi:hypothetical protein